MYLFLVKVFLRIFIILQIIIETIYFHLSIPLKIFIKSHNHFSDYLLSN